MSQVAETGAGGASGGPGGSSGAAALHACFASGELRVWGESASAFVAQDRGASMEEGGVHPFALGADAIRSLLARTGETAREAGARGESAEIELVLPGGNAPAPSAALVRSAGLEPDLTDLRLRNVRVPSIAIPSDRLAAALDDVAGAFADSERTPAGLEISDSVEFFALVSRLCAHLLSQHRFVPMLMQDAAGKLSGAWSPWFGDEQTADRLRRIINAMPAAARAAADELDHDPWRIVDAFGRSIVDAACREALIADDMFETVEDRDANADGQVAWLQGLLSGKQEVPAATSQRSDIARAVRRWISSLEDRGQSSDWRLLLRLNEPVSDELPETIDAPSPDLMWSVSFHLQSQEDSEIVIDASDLWLVNRETMNVGGLSLENPQELLLAELGRASKLFKPLESALDESEPIEVLLETKKAYEFLREVRPILQEQGFGVETPGWWESPAGRLGAKLKIESDPIESMVDTGSSDAGGAGPAMGLTALVGYHWEIAIGDTTLTLKEFEQLAGKSSPLIRIDGRWVEIRPEDVKSAIEFIRENPGGEMRLAEAMRLAYASDPKQTGVPVLGLSATGWVETLLGGTQAKDESKVEGDEGEGSGKLTVPIIDTPDDFHGTLRPYQQRGLSWMAFCERLGFGCCLADDMGLGKTVQLLALMVHERAEARRRAGGTGPEAEAAAAAVLPTLLVVPMSVVGNWVREARRFAPQLRVLVHHGVDRMQGDDLLKSAMESDIVVTTYALANRDREQMEQVTWGRIVLDEAQYIKNPAAKQSISVRSIKADRRIALTGTPVENRLSELWSIMDFLNPGYLGGSGQFRKRFSVPIERYRDAHKAEQLRGLVRPFILRRVKTDPTVVADLPEKLETREFSHLTSEQAALYESCVKRMLTDVESSEGIHRRGLVLAALIRLKQICNHPSQMLKDHDFSGGRAPDPARSGKCTRLLEMLDEVLAEGERSLIFTQFRQMGHLLSAMLRHELGREVLFLHGGTPQGQREKLVERFQDPSEDAPILLLSLKAGGVGLNLTAATHVFHFDRWWNPAVENQATDRAYRIGQTRTVHVHKFVVRGTLEERIDEMIEAKTELAQQIIGAGERWLTELDTDQLKDILTLRADAVGDEDED